MKKFDHVYFNDYTQTYRSFPQNYWLASIKDGKLVFDSWDSAINDYSFKNDVTKLHSDIQECKQVHKKLTRSHERIPVIVRFKDGLGLGVQFWTDWMITNIIATNTDDSLSWFVAKI